MCCLLFFALLTKNIDLQSEFERKLIKSQSETYQAQRKQKLF